MQSFHRLPITCFNVDTVATQKCQYGTYYFQRGNISRSTQNTIIEDNNSRIRGVLYACTVVVIERVMSLLNIVIADYYTPSHNFTINYFKWN
jgi:hypothetical protein